ncbi:MAG TPA: Clp1/GlmU family protein [Methanocellaceae archaeon]|jgi:polynucleotide 5'-hydroxyl-kinase GRC3/NOL9
MSDEKDISRLIENVFESRIAMVIGKVDSGKSTLIKKISEMIDVSIVDADIGQSDIGPPTVVSLGEKIDGRYRMIDGYFCGSTSPARHFLQLMAGTVRMTRASKKSPVLVNTIGLATGDVGRSFHTESINALNPDLIICIGNGDELRYLDAFERGGARVLHLPVSIHAKRKTISERTQNRQLAFKEHFQGSSSHIFSFDQFSSERSLLFNGRRCDVTNLTPGLVYAEVSGGEAVIVSESGGRDRDKIISELGAGTIQAYTIDDLIGALVGLMDARGRFCGLGIVEHVDFKERTIEIYTAVKDFSILQFGSIKLDTKDFSYKGPFHPQIFKA